LDICFFLSSSRSMGGLAKQAHRVADCPRFDE
jgi:hypothetical protein